MPSSKCNNNVHIVHHYTKSLSYNIIDIIIIGNLDLITFLRKFVQSMVSSSQMQNALK